MRKWHRTLTLALLLLAFALWSLPIAGLELWGDELYTAVITTKPLSDMLHIALIDAVHPPLYYIFMAGWQTLVGSTPFALRIPEVWMMLLGIALLARLGRELHSARMGRMALLLGALSPFCLWYAQEIRMYSFLFALTTAAMLFLCLALKGKRSMWLAQALATAAMVNIHYFGFFTLLAPFTFMAAERSRRRQLPKWMIANALGALTFTPWMIAWVNRTPKYTGIAWIPKFTLSDLPLTLGSFFFAGSEAWPVILGIAGVGLLVALVATFSAADPQRWRPWLFIATTLPGALLALISTNVFPLYVDRYLIIVLPAIFLWVAWGLSQLSGWLARLALLSIIVGMLGGIVGINTLPAWQRPQWKQAMALLGETANPQSDTFYTSSPYTPAGKALYLPEFPNFEPLIPLGNAPDRELLTPQCTPAQPCWIVWEHFFILDHFPPAVGAGAQNKAQELAATHPAAVHFLARQDSCEKYSFTHIEVWRCVD